MKNILLAVIALAATSASASFEQIPVCVNSNSTVALSYDGVKFERTVLNGVAIGKPEVLPISGEMTALPAQPGRVKYSYPLSEGRTAEITWIYVEREIIPFDQFGAPIRDRVEKMVLRSANGQVAESFDICTRR